jgi:hypothetical protein
MKHRRSFYLDDLDPPVGALVICKAAIGCPDWTVGKTYQVHPGPTLKNDRGEIVIPSGRFQLKGDPANARPAP